jgi:hypothetical protein
LETTPQHVLEKQFIKVKKRRKQKETENKLTVFGVWVEVGLSLLMVTRALAAKDVIVFEAPNGKVTFNHKKHSETLKIGCLKLGKRIVDKIDRVLF